MGQLTEQSLMRMGGEEFELSRKKFASMRLTDSSDSLEIKYRMTREMESTDKRFRDRLLALLKEGHEG